ncbi:hypothetical protein J25TS5_32460 [Paenibacillus faecis]|uniref:YsnF/AvaK domain-containing protein n=1 Tax=Paenibacillus faecis TaxID=862114 RepID=A0A5D0CZ92_9BACL|nr:MULTISPECIES: YsnF/AvaK domain-containing protein [Paenibacillus]MCA1295755.1 YsnF/AvaK domain-containing protein [Paenibacillus sp. alder61]TYA15050.1 YsnF/AvaK domain-containing protein [Paenibacillus faecis]GIO86314.1 hypothetical protein J25TS5_32460 [Paenibacillus faecis]
MAKNKIVGVFASERDASEAIMDLRGLGYKPEEISVIGKNKEDIRDIHEETGTKAPEGIAAGAATGGLLGGVAGLLAGLGALAIPGIGPIVAAGPIAATLTGAAVGAGTGGLVGGLVGLGIPEEEAEEYDAFVKHGRILVMVDADELQETRVYGIFRNHHSLNAHHYRDAQTTETREPAGTFYQEIATLERTPEPLTEDAREERRMPLREEQLDISKRREPAGEVNLRKEVVEEQQTIDVPVSREEVVVEKKVVPETAGEAMGEGPIGTGETIRIPVSEERVEVTKRPVVTGEVEVHKREVQDTEQVRDTLRREEARLDRTGNPRVTGDSDLD